MRGGVKMMAVNEMRRRRDSRGRYMGDDDYRRMGNDHGTYMGYDREMNDQPEMRRRRDSRGRYMEDDDYREMAFRPWPDPHIPPYLDRPDMTDARRMDGSSDRMRDRNVINIRDYQDRRKIGFGSSRMGDGDDDMRMHMGRSAKPRHMMGMIGGGSDFSREDAERWVKQMKCADPNHPTGGKWTPEQITPFASKYGFPTEGKKFWEFYAIMNAMYCDNYETAKEFGMVNRPEFFASLAKDWLKDKDAVEDKISLYYEYIAKREDE